MVAAFDTKGGIHIMKLNLLLKFTWYHAILIYLIGTKPLLNLVLIDNH